MYSRFLLPAMVVSTATATITMGECPDITRQQNFELDSYTGRWYEQARDSETRYEIGATCVTATYTNNNDGSIKVMNQSYYEGIGWTGGPTTAYLTDPEADEGAIYVTYTGIEPPPGTEPNYNVLSTDYENYTVVYDC